MSEYHHLIIDTRTSTPRESEMTISLGPHRKMLTLCTHLESARRSESMITTSVSRSDRTHKTEREDSNITHYHRVVSSSVERNTERYDRYMRDT